MGIPISRQSVCMGDDSEDHTIQYAIGPSTTFSDLFRDLVLRDYFPSVYGNDVVWVLQCGEDDLISWKTKENQWFSRFVTEEPAILSGKRWETAAAIHFSYYSPPVERARQIFNMFHGEKFPIWHEGYLPEYESYHIQEHLEENWRKALSSRRGL